MSDSAVPRSPRGPHASPETLFSAVREPKSAAGVAALDHASTCAECSEELVHARAFLRRGGSGAAVAWKRFQAGRGARRRRAVPAWALAAAAAAIVAIGTPILLRRTAADVERGERSGVTLVSPRGLLGDPPREFAYRLPPGRTGRVMLFDAERTLEWTSAPSNGSVTLPEAERERLKRGRDYFWTIVGAEGAPVARFRVR